MIELPREKIAELCRKYAVKRLWVFGSAVSGKFALETSDVDFVVEFLPPPPGLSLPAQYFDFWEDLRALLKREVDLVERCAIKNPYFKRNIEEQEVLLFAA
ncbi:hypothetical protein FCG40_01390 [Fimbriimonadia bacterium ATM]|nr:MAG: hypothetical protein EDM73_10115 [Armatimonadota bacterium]MBC6970277.1 hypothetical protein [Armatimonadota bacterium]MCE7899543.1 hypothetical protein [Armatimonadetes bacterium ATM1]MDL1927631.1 hypothetical protein [Fimbriimonadia bacterium ATM]RIJ96441.1 MAG: hypothetical protein DCC45_07215 [Armatimonadota bacterium]